MKTRLKLYLSQIQQLFRPRPFQAGLFDVFEEMRRIQSDDDRTTWFEHLGQWLAKDSATPGLYSRFRFLFQQLEKDDEVRALFQSQLELLFSEGALLRLLLQTGFSDHSGLLQETGRRIMARILPSVRQNDFFEITKEVIQSEDDLDWFGGIPTEILDQLGHFLTASDGPYRLVFSQAATEVILVFAVNLAHLGLTRDIRQRMDRLVPSESPFLRLQGELMALVAKESLAQRLDNKIPSLIKECQEAVRRVYEDMEQNGTSVGLVYRLEVITAALDRIQLLLSVLRPTGESLDPQLLHQLFFRSVEATFESQSIIAHVHQQTHLLSRKIAERNGESGDHYIARGKEERRKLFYSAFKGGAIVVMMTIAKLTLHAWHLPVLLDATLIWGVYSAGFLIMQFTDSTLATKLPSFTASKLARLMMTVRMSTGLDSMVTEVRTVLASQGVAFAANLLAVIPLSLLIETGFYRAFGTHVLSESTAHTTLVELHPLLSLAVPFGMLTGVLLWISSLAGGWFENWIVFQKIPTAIEQHKRFKQIFGSAAAQKTASWLEHNASGISANITLGFLFGFIPFVGHVTGLPLDSKHVTISSASAALSALTLDSGGDWLRMVLWASGGLVLIGLSNLLVSFTLALIVAARASAVNPRRFRVLLIMLGRRLFGLR